MTADDHIFTAELWRHEGPAAWHFISLPEELTDELRAAHGYREKAFGSLAVRVKIGRTEWETSVFYDGKLETYLLPVKAKVRSAEDLEDGDQVRLRLTPLDF